MTIRNLDDAVKRRLRLRAALHDRSMEDEARDILSTAVGETRVPRGNLGSHVPRPRFLSARCHPCFGPAFSLFGRPQRRLTAYGR